MSGFTQQIESLTHAYTPEARWDIALLGASSHSLIEEFRTDPTAPEPMEAASVNKLAIARAFSLAEPDADLGKEMTLEESDRHQGAGVLHLFPAGYRLPLGAVQFLALSQSDNTATGMWVRHLGGPGEINSILATSHPTVVGGILTNHRFEHTRLKPLDDSSDPRARYEYGQTTATEAAQLLLAVLQNPAQAEALHHGNFNQGLRSGIEQNTEVWDPRRVRAAKLLRQIGLPLPQIFCDWVRSAEPPATINPNKEGRYEGLRHDVALIDGIAVAALSSGHPEADEAMQPHPAWEVQRHIGQFVLRYRTPYD